MAPSWLSMFAHSCPHILTATKPLVFLMLSLWTDKDWSPLELFSTKGRLAWLSQSSSFLKVRFQEERTRTLSLVQQAAVTTMCGCVVVWCITKSVLQRSLHKPFLLPCGNSTVHPNSKHTLYFDFFYRQTLRLRKILWPACDPTDNKTESLKDSDSWNCGDVLGSSSISLETVPADVIKMS